MPRLLRLLAIGFVILFAAPLVAQECWQAVGQCRKEEEGRRSAELCSP
jgi:hypothetical protein